MKGNYDIVRVDAERILVIIHPNCQITHAEIEKLLVLAGINLDCVEFIPIGEVDTLEKLEEGTPIIIPVDQGLVDDSSIQESAMVCANIKGQVISIFGPGVSFEGLTNVADNYGTQISWNPQTLNICIVSPDKASPTDSSGKKKKRTKAGQVNC